MCPNLISESVYLGAALSDTAPAGHRQQLKSEFIQIKYNKRPQFLSSSVPSTTAQCSQAHGRMAQTGDFRHHRKLCWAVPTKDVSPSLPDSTPMTRKTSEDRNDATTPESTLEFILGSVSQGMVSRGIYQSLDFTEKRRPLACDELKTQGGHCKQGHWGGGVSRDIGVAV